MRHRSPFIAKRHHLTFCNRIVIIATLIAIIGCEAPTENNAPSVQFALIGGRQGEVMLASIAHGEIENKIIELDKKIRVQSICASSGNVFVYSKELFIDRESEHILDDPKHAKLFEVDLSNGAISERCAGMLPRSHRGTIVCDNDKIYHLSEKGLLEYDVKQGRCEYREMMGADIWRGFAVHNRVLIYADEKGTILARKLDGDEKRIVSDLDDLGRIIDVIDGHILVTHGAGINRMNTILIPIAGDLPKSDRINRLSRILSSRRFAPVNVATDNGGEWIIESWELPRRTSIINTQTNTQYTIEGYAASSAAIVK